MAVLQMLSPCSQNDQQLDCALDLMRRLPPQQIEKNLSDLIDLVSYCLCFVPSDVFMGNCRRSFDLIFYRLVE